MDTYSPPSGQPMQPLFNGQLDDFLARNRHAIGHRQDCIDFIKKNPSKAAVFTWYPALFQSLLDTPDIFSSPAAVDSYIQMYERSVTTKEEDPSIYASVQPNVVQPQLPMPPIPASSPRHYVPSSPEPSVHSPLSYLSVAELGHSFDSYRIDIDPAQDVLFLKDKKKTDTANYLRVTITPQDATLVVVNLEHEGGEAEDTSVKLEQIAPGQYMIPLDTSALYGQAGIQALRLLLKDRDSGEVLAERVFHYIVHSHSNQRLDMFVRVVQQKLQQEQTWSVAWEWISHFWAKRCYRDLTGKQKTKQQRTNQQPPQRPLPPEDVIRSIHRLAATETITIDRFKRLISWISAFHLLYNSPDVHTLMNLRIDELPEEAEEGEIEPIRVNGRRGHASEQRLNQFTSKPGAVGTLLHLISPSKVEPVLKAASEQTGRPTFLLRFSSNSEVLALNVYQRRMLSAAARIYDLPSDRGLRAALTQILDLLKQPQNAGMVAVLTTEYPYQTCSVKCVELIIKNKLKCFKDHNPDLPPGYIDPLSVVPALNEQGPAGSKRKQIAPSSEALNSPSTTPLSSAVSSPYNPAASPSMNHEWEKGYEAEEEMDQGQVLTSPHTIARNLFSQAVESEEVARNLYLLLHQRFAGLSLT